MLQLDRQGGQEKTCSAGKPGWGQDYQLLPTQLYLYKNKECRYFVGHHQTLSLLEACSLGKAV